MTRVFYTNSDDGIWLECELCKREIKMGFNPTLAECIMTMYQHKQEPHS